MNMNEQRKEKRVNSDIPVQINIGSQLTLQGKLKDISAKSAFITIKASVYLKLNDEIGFAIPCPGKAGHVIEGMARISRIAGGEGFAFYFTSMSASSEARLKSIIEKIA